MNQPPATITLSPRRALLGLPVVCALLDWTDEDFNRKIETGFIPYAFDLRGRHARKACVRVLARSVLEIRTHGQADDSMALPLVIESILPAQRETFFSSELARLFGCNSAHINYLVRDGLLSKAENSQRENEPSKILRPSVIQFLAERRLA